jgi:dienelactone hydrolase
MLKQFILSQVRFIVVVSALILVSGGVSAQTAIAMPDLAGAYSISRKDYHLIDESRQEVFTENTSDVRELMVTIYYPAQSEMGAEPAPYVEGILADVLAESNGISPDLWSLIQTKVFTGLAVAEVQASYPVLIFSPGMGSQPLYYTSLLSEIASHGYIIVAISHPYSTDVTIFPDGRMVQANEAGTPFGATREEQDAKRAELGAVWVADIRFVLDEMEKLNASDDLLGGHLDLAYLGTFGHSFGGAAAAEAAYEDDRIDAAINMDGTFFGEVVEQGLHKPLMLMEALSDAELAELGLTREQYEQNEEYQQRTRVYESAQTGYRFHLEGARHNTYATDLVVFAAVLPDQLPLELVGEIEGGRAVDIISTYIFAFFHRHLKGVEDSFLDGPSSEYPEVVFQMHTP